MEDYPRALEWFEKSLAAHREVGNRFLEGNVLLLMGGAYFSQFKYDRALETYQQALPIFRDLGLRVQEYRALSQIGNTYGAKGDKERAVDFLQQSLAIQRELKDNSSQLNTLALIMVNGSKAEDLYYKGLSSQARAAAPHDIKLAEDVLQLARELKQPDMEATALQRLGGVYYILKDYDKAIELLQQSLNIARQVKALQTETTALSFLSQIYTHQGKERQTIELSQRQIEIAREQKDPLSEASDLNSLASTYGLLGEYQKGIELYQQALAKGREVNSSQLAPIQQDDVLKTLSATLGGLSLGYRLLGEFDKALDFAKQRLTYVQTLKKPNLEAEALIDLGELYTDMRDLPKAIESTQQALTIARQIKDPEIEANALQKLSQAYTKQGKHSQAIELANQALQVAKRLENTDIEQHTLGELRDIYDNQGNYQKALELAQQRLTLIQQTKSNYEFLALQDLSRSYGAVGDTQKAIEVANQSVAKSRQQQNPNFEGQALAALSEAYNAQGKYEQGIEIGQQSLAIAQKIKNFRSAVVASNSLSDAYQKLGDYQKVISVAEPGLVSAQKYKNRQQEASLLMNLGDAYQIVGNYSKGKEFIEQSLAIARELKNPGLEAQALSYLGNLYSNSNDFQKALELSQQSLKIATELKSPYLQSIPQFNLGDIYRSLGNYQKSREYYQQALATMRQLKNRQGEGYALLNIANIYFAQGQPQQTIELAQQALTIFQEIKVPGQEVFATRMLSYGYAELNNDAKAMESAQAFLAFAKKTQNPVWEKQALNFLGQLHRKFGRNEQAIAAYQQALAIATPTEVAGSKSGILYGLASIYRDLNQPNVAITYYKQSINGIEEVRRNIQGLPPELQNSFLQATVDFNNVKTADIYRQLADLLLSQGRTQEAQQVLELLKIQEIRDVARGGNVNSDKPNVPLSVTEAKVPIASESLIALGRQISECEQTNCNQKTALNDKRTALVVQFNQELATIDQEIRERLSKDKEGFFDPTLRAKAKEIVQAQPGTVMIYPLVLENKLWLLMYSEGEVVKKFEISVGRQELGKTSVKFRRLLQDRFSDSNEIKKTGKQLYDWLIKPIEPELKQNQIKHLVFSLDRVTRYIPMSVLFDGEKYLIENYTIDNIVSAAFTDMNAKLPVGTQNNPVLAMGLSNAVPGYEPLKNVPAELDAIVRKNSNDQQGIYPGDQFLNGAFDFKTLRDNLTGHKILHLATHGAFVPGSADKSYLLLGTGEQLTIPKIDALTGLSNIHLVVLSACETALSAPNQDGIEIASAANYFLKGGAKAVMASLWSVDDASTSITMQQFYKNLATGTAEKPMTKSQALRQAQLSLLQGKLTAANAPERAIVEVHPGEGARVAVNNNPGFTHPYYWAPFILIGNGL